MTSNVYRISLAKFSLEELCLEGTEEYYYYGTLSDLDDFLKTIRKEIMKDPNWDKKYFSEHDARGDCIPKIKFHRINVIGLP